MQTRHLQDDADGLPDVHRSGILARHNTVPALVQDVISVGRTEPHSSKSSGDTVERGGSCGAPITCKNPAQKGSPALFLARQA